MDGVKVREWERKTGSGAAFLRKWNRLMMLLPSHHVSQCVITAPVTFIFLTFYQSVFLSSLLLSLHLNTLCLCLKYKHSIAPGHLAYVFHRTLRCHEPCGWGQLDRPSPSLLYYCCRTLPIIAPISSRTRIKLSQFFKVLQTSPHWAQVDRHWGSQTHSAQALQIKRLHRCPWHILEEIDSGGE